MKRYEKSTLWIAILIAIVVTLIFFGGWRERGYIAFGADFVILIFSPFIIRAWYVCERNEYRYRNTMMERSKK